MWTVAVADSKRREKVDAPSAVRERLQEFAREVLAEATNRPAQMLNGDLYLRGLVEEGPRKSLEPLVARLGGEADYESMQQFLADSPWDPSAVLCARRRAGGAGDRRRGLGGRRHRVPQGRQALAGGKAPVLGHARQDRQLPDRRVGPRGRRAGDAALGWALYLPEEWCEDLGAGARRRSRTRSASRRSRAGVELMRAGGRLGAARGRRCSPTGLRRRTPAARASARARARVRVGGGAGRRSSRPRRASRSRARGHEGPAANRPGPTASRSRSALWSSGWARRGWQRSPAATAPTARPVRAGSLSSASCAAHAGQTGNHPAAARGVADHRVA